MKAVLALVLGASSFMAPLFARAAPTIARIVQASSLSAIGKWKDVGRVYFHNGAATTRAEAVNSYDTRSKLNLTDRQKADLAAFLRAL